jgi:hypothetical protein
MSKRIDCVKIITGRKHRPHYCAEEKVGLVEETTPPGITVGPSPGWMTFRPAFCSNEAGHWLDLLKNPSA